MTAPENEQTDIIPALRLDEDTSVDRFAPVRGARHRRAHRPGRGPVAGVAAILTVSAAAMYVTYTLGAPRPQDSAPVPPAAESAGPTATAPVVAPPTVRPSRTRADRHQPRRTATPRATKPSPALVSPTPKASSPERVLSPSPTRSTPTGSASPSAPLPSNSDLPHQPSPTVKGTPR